MAAIHPFGRLNGKHGLPPMDGVPIVGQPIEIHAVQFNVTLSCKCATPHTVLIGDGRRPLVCPKCLAVYAVTSLKGQLLPEVNQHGEVLQMSVNFGRVGTASPGPDAPPDPGPTEGGEGDGQ